MASLPKDDVLDNAVWHALRTRQAHFAEADASGRAIRFDREVAFFGAVDVIDPTTWKAQVELAGPEGYTMLFRDEVPGPPPGWEEVFRGMNKIIIDSSASGGSGVVPYLPLPEIQKRSRPSTPAGGGGQ